MVPLNARRKVHVQKVMVLSEAGGVLLSHKVAARSFFCLGDQSLSVFTGVLPGSDVVSVICPRFCAI
jgi:hypothetical protein